MYDGMKISEEFRTAAWAEKIIKQGMVAEQENHQLDEDVNEALINED